MNAGKRVLPDAVLGRFIYPSGFQGGPGEIGVLNSYWLLTWDSVVAESTGRSEDASPKHSWVTGWFQAEVLETANSYWPLTSAGSLHWEPNFHWLKMQERSGQQGGELEEAWGQRPS